MAGRGVRPQPACQHGLIEPSSDEADPAAAELSDAALDTLLAEGRLVDELAEEPDPTVEELASRRFDAWRRRSAIGALGTGFAFGLKEIFYPTDDEPAITAPAPGDPADEDGRIRVILDPDDPTKSVAVLPAAPTPASD